MAVAEEQVSVLIPAYKRPEMTLATVQAALATGAGEVIVSEDDPGTDINEYLKNFNDRRLIVIRQTKNQGLWKNHLVLLKMATKPWIKFIQTDDELLPGALKAMCDHADPETAIVSALPLYKDLGKNTMWKVRSEIDKPTTWNSEDYMVRLLTRGNELGRPSYSLVRADVIERSEQAWENNRSCDLIMNVIASSKGKVVLLPQGYVVTGLHESQDGATQSYQLKFERLYNSLAYLNRYDKRFRDFVSIYGAVEFEYMVKVFFATIRRKKNPFYLNLIPGYLKLLTILRPASLFKYLPQIKLYHRHKFDKNTIKRLPVQ